MSCLDWYWQTGERSGLSACSTVFLRVKVASGPASQALTLGVGAERDFLTQLCHCSQLPIQTCTLPLLQESPQLCRVDFFSPCPNATPGWLSAPSRPLLTFLVWYSLHFLALFAPSVIPPSSHVDLHMAMALTSQFLGFWRHSPGQSAFPQLVCQRLLLNLEN